MVKAWRDGIQKALWVNKGNPNRDRLRKAVTDMLNDPEARIRLQKKLGKVLKLKLNVKHTEEKDGEFYDSRTTDLQMQCLWKHR